MFRQSAFRKVKNSGFGIIEIIVAVGILGIIASTALVMNLHGFSMDRLGQEETSATFFAQEGIEGLRSLKNYSWANLDTGSSDCAGSKSGGVTQAGGVWVWKDTPDMSTDNRLERNITISNVCRNESGEIVEAGGTYDPDTKKAVSTVSWNFMESRVNSVEQAVYFTNWEKAVASEDPPPPAVCSWNNLQIPAGGAYQYPGNQNARKVQVQGNYAYVIISAEGNPGYDFAVMDVSDPQNVSLAGSLKFAQNNNQSFTNLALSGNYVFATTRHDSKELVVIDVSNPTSPQVVATLDLIYWWFFSNEDALGIYVADTTAYIVFEGRWMNHELAVVDISNPLSPSVMGSADLGTTNQGGNEVYVTGNYAFIASQDSSKEMKVVNVSNPYFPIYLSNSYFNIPGASVGYAITGFDNAAALGAKDGFIYFIDISDPTSIRDPESLISTYGTGAEVYDLAYEIESQHIFAVRKQDSGQELKALNVSDVSNPVLTSAMEFSPNMLGVAADGGDCVIYAVGSPNLEEEFYAVTGD